MPGQYLQCDAGPEQVPDDREEECDYVNVPVILTADDLKNLRRIFEGKYEPLEKATLVVRVKRNKP